MFDNLAIIGDLTQEDFVIDSVEFHIEPLNPFVGYKMLEEIRNEVGRVTGMQSQPLNVTMNGAALPGDFIQILLNMPKDYVESLRARLAETVYYRYPGGGIERNKLAGNEEAAFSALKPIAVYEVLVRCLAVNFTSSFISVFSTGKRIFDLAMQELLKASPESAWTVPDPESIALPDLNGQNLNPSGR